MSSRQKSPKKPKAADNTQRHVQRASPAPTWLNVVRAAAFLFLAGVASPISQLNLSPVYGSIPASLHHQRSMTITAAAALLTRRAIKKHVSADLAPFVAVIAYWTPVIQYYLFSHSTELGIDYGPLIVESLTYLPLLFLAIYSAADLLESFIVHSVTSQSAASEALIPVLSYFAVSSVSKLASSLLPSFMGTSMYGTRVSLSLLVGGFSSLASIPSPMLALSFPAILHVLLANPHAWDSLANTALNTTHNYTLLARHESITGYISVLESHSDHAFRLLRCDHSLLGGEWLVTPAAYAKGQRNRESIFAVFVLLEAVRLIEPPPTIAPGAQESALVIGLGIGTAPNALIAHGINTTIVELDPVVHAYATKYFHLSPNHTAVIADAVQYVADTSLAAPRSFTYIIHDVFTGGAEPVYLFTSEFMRGLYNLLADDGVVAINYAGDVNLPATKLVLNTIHAVFPVCRLFRDSPPPPPASSSSSDPSSPSSSEEEKEEEQENEDKPDFINMVIFCHKSPHTRLSFRDATDADFLDSIARRNFLVPRDDLEVAYTYEEGAETMGRGDVGELEKYHKEGAVSHWRIMRSVLPAGVWEMW